MLVVCLALAPFLMLWLFGFASMVDPKTGHIAMPRWCMKVPGRGEIGVNYYDLTTDTGNLPVVENSPLRFAIAILVKPTEAAISIYWAVPVRRIAGIPYTRS
jgi:hypothetical protein